MKTLFTIAALFLCSITYGQKLGPYLISNNGSILGNDEIMLYLALGEPINSVIEGDGISVAQGVLQIIITSFDPGSVGTEDTELIKIRTFPNPTANSLTIETSEENIQYTLFSNKGNKLQSGRILASTSEALDLSGLVSGNYFLKLHSGTTSLVKKIIIQK